jgi:murein DD-endopeptidase MepM/ murein hydrolase activator NlpD
MIHLKNILFEQTDYTNKIVPNILFIGDFELKDRISFAKKLIASRKVTGEVKVRADGNTDRLLELLQSNIAENFDAVMLFSSGQFESEQYNETYDNLNIAIDICKSKSIPLVLFTFPDYTFIKNKKQKEQLKNVQLNLNDINNWLRKSADADFIVDIDLRLDEKKTFLNSAGTKISSDGHNLILKRLQPILKDLDIDIDIEDDIPKEKDQKLSGVALAKLQKLLVMLGYEINKKELVNNEFGISTQQALSNFQLKNGLLPSGKVDLKTVKRLKSSDAIPANSKNISAKKAKETEEQLKTPLKTFDATQLQVGKAGSSADALAMARNLMRDLNLTEAQAAGIVGNMIAESNVENARPQGSKRGVKGPLVVDGVTGYGIVQWTSKNRQQNLADFAISKGVDISQPLSMDIEYQFFIKEFTTSYKNVLDQIISISNNDNAGVKESSTIFMQKYERPAGFDTPAKIEQRYQLSKPVFDDLMGGKGTESETTTDADGNIIDDFGNIISTVILGSAVIGKIGEINYAHKLEYNPSSGFKSAARPNHQGIDYHADKHTPVVLTQGGKISSTHTGCDDVHNAQGEPVDSNCGGGFGNHVKVKFDDGAKCTFAHFTVVNVSPGERVEPGTVIGTVGDTGHSYGAHLHFEYHPDGTYKAAGTPDIAQKYFGFGYGGSAKPYSSPNANTKTSIVSNTGTTNISNTKKSSGKSIIIGDSYCTYIEWGIGNRAKTYNSLYKSGKGSSWLNTQLTSTPMDVTVNNVIISIGTNDLYNTNIAPITQLVSNLRLTFPNAKLFVVQGTYGPKLKNYPNLQKITDKQVKDYYAKFSALGVIVVTPAVGNVEDGHGRLDVYKTIGTNIINKLK